MIARVVSAGVAVFLTATASLLPHTARADDFYMVLGSFSTEASAQRATGKARERLDAGIDLDVGRFESGDRVLFRVLAGPYADRETLEDMRPMFADHDYEDAWILRETPAHTGVEAPRTGVEPARTQIETQPPGTVRGEKTRLPLPVEEAPGVETTTLVETVKLALERNLGLQASTQSVVSGEEGVREARSRLLPNLEAGVRQTAIDPDRAEASFGQAPEFRASTTLSVRQSIYSDPALASVQVQELLQKARESDRRKVALDTILDASVGFLRLLRRRALAKIVADDLELTRENYEHARIRLEVGVANKAEVYRWETRLASSKQELNTARAEVEKAQVVLNEVINRPLGQTFHPASPDLKDGYLLFARDDIWQALRDEERQKKLKDYWITEALLFAPELDAVRNQRAAQYRRLLAAKRRVRIPEIVLSIDATKHVSEKGKGSEDFEFDIPGVDSGIDFDRDNFEWSAAVTASLPLYGGGGNRARIRKAQAETERMDLLYDEALLAVQSGILRNLSAFEASLNNIELARDQAEAAKNNLELVSSSYERGVVTIIDLLDAQVAALSAELSAANAVYDFLIEYMKLQRTVGRFDIALSPDERAAARDRLQPYVE